MRVAAIAFVGLRVRDGVPVPVMLESHADDLLKPGMSLAALRLPPDVNPIG